MKRLTALLLWLVLLAPSAALGGTTGSISGQVLDSATRQPLADVRVIATSPSQQATTTTDKAGHFSFISLAPDTYTLSLNKTGYEPASVAGISVFADQSQTVPLVMRTGLTQIARVSSRSSISPVRAGTGTDVYSVNASVAAAAAPIGGGGDINNAYSAIAAMPGAYVPPNQVGVNQTVYIRGGYYDQIGYEYDGIPVNRSFDNYPSSGLSNLGQQEIEIYAGGGGSDANATGLSGFVNQVIKTGTYPGYGTGSLGAATPTFYHDARVEAGGSTPDRLFSYYAGISGTNQDYRYFDQFNGASLTNTLPYGYWPAHWTTNLPFWPAVYPTCSQITGNYNNPAVNNNLVTADPGCFGTYAPNYGQPATLADREAVANFHFGIKHHHDGGRDDVQLLYMSSANFEQDYSSVDDAGPLAQALIGQGDTDNWPDFFTYPAGTPFLAPASTPIIPYLYPGSPTGRCINAPGAFGSGPSFANSCPADALSSIPDNFRDGTWDTASIVKAQYQKNLGSTAYVRLFGYTFYSNTNDATPNGYGINSTLGVQNYDYEVDSHTRGAELQFADQLGSQNTLSGMAAYMTSSTLRYYNHNYDNTPDQQVSNFTNGSQCFATVAGPGIDPASNYTPGDPAPCNDPASQGTFSAPYGNFNGQNPCTDGELAPSMPACTSGASMKLTYLGTTADVNTVTPIITSYALTDEFRPNDKFYVNGSLRFENDTYDLANTNNPGTNFWFAAAQKEFCVNPVTREPVFVPQPPQSIYLFTPYVSFNCPPDDSTGTPVQTVHPNGTDGILLTNSYPSSYSQAYLEPRISATYTLDPNTVIRASAGRYAQQPQNYEIQYTTAQPNLAATLLGFVPFGFDSPLHESQAQFSNNYDASIEHQFKGTDIAIKLSPYYRWATNQLYETVNLPSLGVSPSFNAGTERVDGIEFELTKGDFSRNGLSAEFSYTYTNASEMWNNYQNSTIGPVDQYNQDIEEYNALTKAGGGSQCYINNFNNTVGAPPVVLADPTCAPMLNFNDPIRDPYYSSKAQPLLSPHGWYAPGLDFPYISPNTFVLITSYRHNRYSITPALTLSEGTTYGTPADVVGLDPRSCTVNQGPPLNVPHGNPLSADYTSCGAAITSDGTVPGNLYIPNPQTGTFDTFGEFRQPWQLNLGMQISYDISPRITAKVMATSLINRCFGGSKEPWTVANPPSSSICGYVANTFYNGGNFYNGSGPNDVAANGVPENPYFAQSFVPSYGDVSSFNYPMPLNVYFTLDIKL